MDINGKCGKEYLTEQDLRSHSMWVVHQSDDLYYPVNGPDDLPTDMVLEDLSTRSTFTTPSGKTFFGYIVGLKNIFCIVIFLNNEMYIINKNLFNDCIKTIEKINNQLDQKIKPKDFFPLKYQTSIDVEVFKNIEGEFDIFKPMTDEERLS